MQESFAVYNRVSRLLLLSVKNSRYSQMRAKKKDKTSEIVAQTLCNYATEFHSHSVEGLYNIPRAI